MNVQILSLYWDNVDPEVVQAQKRVFETLGLPISQHRIDGLRHGDWIDWVMGRTESMDVFLFIDIDCVPLSKSAVVRGVQKAAGGVLYGAEGAANHVDPSRSYAAPWYVYIHRRTWDVLGRPSAKETPFGDVCQLWTDTWRQHKGSVELVPPTSCSNPKWDLPGRPLAYGIGTTYGDECYHLFEARAGTKQLFIERCRTLVGDR